jgi:transcriptional regulator with XRE-family HTH domain
MYMKERIAQIIQSEGVTAAQFAEKIGISASSLSHILSGRNNPSLEVVMKIHKTFEDINLNWLLYGEGEMSMDPESTEESPNITSISMSENGEFLSDGQIATENRKEMPFQTAQIPIKEVVREEVKYIEKPAKKITEITIFFDNGTYETFRPEK